MQMSNMSNVAKCEIEHLHSHTQLMTFNSNSVCLVIFKDFATVLKQKNNI